MNVNLYRHGGHFSAVRQGLADAVERRAHLRWYQRLRVPHGRPLAIVLVALVVAAPAVGAVSGWFSAGQPDSSGSPSPGSLFGVVRPGQSRMLPIRVADPQGGPPWGLRLVRTTRGDTCVQLGRVQGGELGSLGIADAWDNDHRFHAIPTSAEDAQDCGSTDAAGHGFVNRGVLGESASANLGGDWITGPQASGCRLPVGGGDPSLPYCPAGSNRIVFYGLLGPDAVSVTYRTPGRGLATERTVGGVGAYLLVFPYNAATCAEYERAAGSAVSCDGDSEGGASPVVPGAVTNVKYTHGRTCSLTQPARLEAAYRAFRRGAVATLGRPNVGPDTAGRPSGNTKWLVAYRRLLAGFLAREHLTLAQFQHELGPGGRQCPAVGWVPFKATKVTAAEVASRIRVREFPVASGRVRRRDSATVAPTARRMELQGKGGGHPRPQLVRVVVAVPKRLRDGGRRLRHLIEHPCRPDLALLDVPGNDMPRHVPARRGVHGPGATRTDLRERRGRVPRP